MMTLIAIFVTLVFCYSLVSGKLGGTVITGPILFTAAGMATFVALPQAGLGGGERETFLVIAEPGLVLLLFTDACHTDLTVPRSIEQLPARLLSAGMGRFHLESRPVCGTQPDGGADVAGCRRADRNTTEPGDGFVHGMVRPRGLASIVLGAMFLEQYTRLPGEPTIRLAVIVTALPSIFLHGFSALPGSGL